MAAPIKSPKEATALGKKYNRSHGPTKHPKKTLIFHRKTGYRYRKGLYEYDIQFT